jgi:hypothetical protein
MSDTLPLPPRPNLEHYKKLAKDFQRACKSGRDNAIGEWAARWAENLARLREREITPEVWRQIKRDAAWIDRLWQKFKKTNEGAARCALADAQFFVARGHGFASWPKFAKHIKELARNDSPVSQFESAVDAIVGGDAATLERLLREDPGLVRVPSTREHRSTLLHYVSANGIEDFRQKTPKNIVQIAEMLLNAGADVNAESDAYGGGCTALGLVATSVHPQRAGVQIALMDKLLEFGAAIDNPTGAGNRHGMVKGCLANGQPQAAEFFVRLGAPLDLETAAALGRLDLVKSYFDGDGSLIPDATQEQLKEGFLHACGYGRNSVVEFLVEKGVDPATQSGGGQTGLHRAAVGGHAEVVKQLLQCKAPIGARDSTFGGSPLEWALHGWGERADEGERSHYHEVVALLAAAGARVDPKWFESDEVPAKLRADPLLVAALKGNQA